MNAVSTRVLLVDDDEDVFVMIQDLLDEIENSAFTLDWIDTYDHGLKAILLGEHHVYLLDYRLGERDGLQLLHEARIKGCHAPLILLTSQDDRKIGIGATETGGADYLVKDRIDAPLLERSIRYSIQHQRTLAALRESEERYAVAVHTTNDALWDWNLRTDEVYYSPRWANMLGCNQQLITSSPDEWFRRVHPRDLEKVRTDLTSHLEGRTDHFQIEHRMLYRDGSYRWALARALVVRDTDGRPYRIAGSHTDITSRRLAEQKLQYDANHDGLTGLPNRTQLMEQLAARLSQDELHDGPFALLCIDIDRFKNINDSLGHLVGDQLLVAITQRLQTSLRSQDVVTRLGGDEFTILLHDVGDTSHALRVVERIQEGLRAPFILGQHRVFATASIGIVLSTGEYSQPEELLRDADIAMYQAKTQGRACYAVFDTAMHAQVVEALQFESDLHRAVENQEFVLFYQPIVAVETGAVSSVEALLRWQHPERGILRPSQFIQLAEETGLIIPIGEWALRTAIEQARVWQERYPHLRMEVNVSARQFYHEGLLDMIGNLLETADLLPQTLGLELTETVAMKDIDYSISMLDALDDMGIGVSIDDFGTGYSSLGCLKSFPIRALKLDRSFIKGIPDDSNDRAIAEAIIAMARSLRLRVVAAGVETEGQLDFLRSQGCDEYQGYLFSRPSPPNEIMQQLQRIPSPTSPQ